MHLSIFKPFRILLILFLLQLSIIPKISSGQQSNIRRTDSLRNVINNSAGAEKINALLLLSTQISNNNSAEALTLAQLALQESRAFNIKKAELEALIAIGKIMIDRSLNFLLLKYLWLVLYCKAGNSLMRFLK